MKPLLTTLAVGLLAGFTAGKIWDKKRPGRNALPRGNRTGSRIYQSIGRRGVVQP